MLLDVNVVGVVIGAVLAISGIVHKNGWTVVAAFLIVLTSMCGAF